MHPEKRDQIDALASLAFADLLMLWSDPKNWTQHFSARNAEGVSCDEDNPDAVCWCLAGGIHHFARVRSPAWKEEVTAAMERRVVSILREQGFLEMDDDNYWRWNDMPGRTVGDVLQLVREALK